MLKLSKATEDRIEKVFKPGLRAEVARTKKSLRLFSVPVLAPLAFFKAVVPFAGESFPVR
jgi:hypothetical protein